MPTWRARSGWKRPGVEGIRERADGRLIAGRSDADPGASRGLGAAPPGLRIRPGARLGSRRTWPARARSRTTTRPAATHERDLRPAESESRPAGLGRQHICRAPRAGRPVLARPWTAPPCHSRLDRGRCPISPRLVTEGPVRRHAPRTGSPTWRPPPGPAAVRTGAWRPPSAARTRGRAAALNCKPQRRGATEKSITDAFCPGPRCLCGSQLYRVVPT
jgi:hypothetical protein